MDGSNRSPFPGYYWPMRSSIFLALVSALLFGAATPLSKALLGSINPFLLAGLLYLGAGLALAPWALRSGLGKNLRSLDRKNRLYVLGSVLAGGILGPVFLLFGLSASKSASVSLWLNLELVATMLLGSLFFKDKLTRQGLVTAIGIVAASVLLSFDGGRPSVLGGLLVAIACLAWGLDNNLTALIDGLDPKASTFIKGMGAGATNLAVGLIVASSSSPPLPSIGAALGIGALSYGASIVLYIGAAQGLGASRAQFFFSSSPVFGLVLATMVLGESIGLLQFAAAALMALSYAILIAERHGHEHLHPVTVHTHWHRHDEGHHEHGHDRLSFRSTLFGHAHEHGHEAREHDHPHVPDIHHRHDHAPSRGA